MYYILGLCKGTFYIFQIQLIGVLINSKMTILLRDTLVRQSSLLIEKVKKLCLHHNILTSVVADFGAGGRGGLWEKKWRQMRSRAQSLVHNIWASAAHIHARGCLETPRLLHADSAARNHMHVPHGDN